MIFIYIYMYFSIFTYTYMWSIHSSIQKWYGYIIFWIIYSRWLNGYISWYSTMYNHNWNMFSHIIYGRWLSIVADQQLLKPETHQGNSGHGAYPLPGADGLLGISGSQHSFIQCFLAPRNYLPSVVKTKKNDGTSPSFIGNLTNLTVNGKFQ